MLDVLLQVSVKEVWLGFSSVFLAFVFVFGNSVRHIFQSMLFLFVTQPYDVGDALLIDGDWCCVEQIALQYTQVLRFDNVRIWFPNQVLAAAAVTNISRSANAKESYKVCAVGIKP